MTDLSDEIDGSTEENEWEAANESVFLRGAGEGLFFAPCTDSRPASEELVFYD